MSEQGILAVISGFSGCGKGTVLKKLMGKYDCYALSISATTRLPREDEQEGINYFYKTKEQFQELIDKNALIEYATYNKNFYGTPRDYVEEKLKTKDVILEIEVNGAGQVKKTMPDSVSIFICPPSAEELKRRLEGRNSETQEVINNRLKIAIEESKGIPLYDYMVINETGRIEECADKIHEIIQSYHNKPSQNEEFINKIQNDLKQYL